MYNSAFSEIAETFDFLDNWDDRYAYIIDLGKSYDSLPEELRSETLKIQGCASQVWLLTQTHDKKFHVQGASDAIIVSGLIAILAALYNGLSIIEARKINALESFSKLGLDKHLSAQRSNGLHAMIKHISHILESQ